MKTLTVAALAVCFLGTVASAQRAPYVPVTEEMLRNPSPNDWLMYSRTYDAQRYSPLDQINKSNAGNLRMAWSRGQPAGTQESIPLVHNGIMYVLSPGSLVQALDATNGNLLWEYQRDLPQNQRNGRSKTIAIGDDMIYWTSPDSYVVALDARTGELRWESKTDTRGASSGAVIAGDKVISGGACGGQHVNCYVSAHDAKTGELLWKFYTAAEDSDPGGASWRDTPEDMRVAGTWGLPGTYDPAQNLVIWSVANPTPNTRMERHNGNALGTGTSAPADLYSNSTIAINADTGELAWYYQYLPGDDWDEDFTNERILINTPIRPTSDTAKWFNPAAANGQARDIAIAIGEPGGIFAIDRTNGQFLWGNPWPYDVDNFVLTGIDADGTTHMNTDLIFDGPNQKKLICFFNTKSYWPAAYSPETNSIYAQFTDTCLDMQTLEPGERPRRGGVVRPGSDPDKFGGISKVDAATGKIEHIYFSPVPINSAMLATAGDVIVFGDLDRHVRALDADTGEVLWDQIVGGSISNSTITYSVNGKQYIAVMTGDGLLTPSVVGYVPGLTPPRGSNAIYVFALP